MAIWKLPPIEKIHEAYSAIVDGRVEMFDDHAFVESSDHTKKYTLSWKDDVYISNDNASYWKGYLGYPVIAILMLQNKLPLNRKVADHFEGINWKSLNTEYGNNYTLAVKFIMEGFEKNGASIAEINAEILNVYKSIKNLNIQREKSKIPPPK